MYFSERVKLRRVRNTKNENGYPTQIYEDTEVWANVKSVTRSEFYAANANNIKADIIFEVHCEDWGNQTQVIYNAAVYDVIKTYYKGGGTVELTCSKKAA